MKAKGKTRVVSRKKRTNNAMLHLVLAIGSLVFLFPFFWLLSTSLKEEDQMKVYPPVLIPTRQVILEVDGKKAGLSTMKIGTTRVKVGEVAEFEDGRKRVVVLSGQPCAGKSFVVDSDSLTKVRTFGLKWENYTKALDFLPKETHKGLAYLWNTVVITVLSILGTVLSSSLVAFSFSRLRWPGRDIIFGVLLATMMIPQAVTMMPVFLIFRWLGWIDTLRPLWVPAFFANAFGVFLLRQFFLTIPRDLEEAAKIDGAGYWTIFWRVMVPLVKPALAALTIMTFIASWNNFMGPLIYLNSPEKMTLAYALQLFQCDHGGEHGMLMAASTIVMLPVLAIFFFTQKYFIEGITLTGIKG
ncbi:MAG: carbohydrate ABC transporter permease [Armatimonadota bacterium]|nr:carbohydrate ABC transporter permease [bacterium]